MSTLRTAICTVRLLSRHRVPGCLPSLPTPQHATLRPTELPSLLSTPPSSSSRLITTRAFVTSTQRHSAFIPPPVQPSHRHPSARLSASFIAYTSLPTSSVLCCPPRRHVSIHVTDSTAAEFESEFERLADTVQHALDEVDLGSDDELDLSYASGVLSIRTRLHGTYVLNQHNVTRQVWLSSPVSGPSKYNWHRDRTAVGKGGKQRKGQWCNERDTNKDLMGLLQREFGVMTGQDGFEFDEPF